MMPAMAPLAPMVGTGSRLAQRVREGRDDAAQQVEDDIASVPEPVLHVVAEDPEGPHVPEA